MGKCLTFLTGFLSVMSVMGRINVGQVDLLLLLVVGIEVAGGGKPFFADSLQHSLVTTVSVVMHNHFNLK